MAETNAQAQTYVPRTARKEQIYDPRNLVPRLIRKALSGARAQGGGRAAEQRDELAASHHSITSSALACNVSGTVRPSAFAVLRLMISSNLVGCITGRLAGFSPLSIRPL